MKFLLSTLTLLLSFSAMAHPSEDMLSAIANSYNPEITTKITSNGWSFYGCATREIKITGQDPLDFKSRKVSVTYYQARGARSPAPAVILLPPTGGVNILDRGYANELCWAGMNVALVSGWEHQEPQSTGFEIHDQGALRALTAVRHVVEFLTQEQSPSIGLLGTSIGAITGTLAVGYEPRIASAALIVGSGRFGDVIAESTEEGATRLRKLRMKDSKLAHLEDYRKVLHSLVKTDPASFVNYSGPKKILLVTADQDTTVPTPYQFELVSLIKPKVHLALKGNHIDVIKASFFQKRHEIVRFFKVHL